MNLERTLQEIVCNEQSHARWLNSLSYLEYRGFRKMARTLDTSLVNAEILSHMAEEARHAQFFKRLAVKIGGSKFEAYTDLLAGKAVKKYFYDLDKLSDEWMSRADVLQHKLAVYLTVTYLIEIRAVGLYQVYQRVLHGQNFAISLAPVLSDETKHLSEVLSQLTLTFPRWSEFKRELEALESKCFIEAWAAIESEVARPKELHA